MNRIFITLSLFFIMTCGGGGSAPTEPQEPAPVSNFTATPTTGLQPLEVVFTSTATGTIASYAWNVDSDADIEGTGSTYTHTYSNPGTFSASLTVTGSGGSNTKTNTDMITVISAAPTPTTSTSQTTQEDNSTTIPLMATDPNGQAVTFAISTHPTNGTATLSGTDVTYTPNTNFYGSDSFAYTASNGTYTSEPATITITVTGEDDGNPTTNDVSATTDEDTAVTVDLDATEIDGENYSFTIISQPSNGTLGSISGNQVDYTPNQDWNGTDTFTFEATDDRTARTNVATATITIAAVNDAPIANDVSGSTNENRMIQLDVTLDATDVDGDDLTYSIVGTNNGSITISGSTATYTPNQDWNGTDTFTYKANDGTDDSNTATATITINSVNDAPVTTNQSAATNEDTAVDITLTSTDVDGDTITYSIVSDVSNGTTSLSGATVNYTPTANWNGTDTFTFKANDGTLDSNTATLTITVAAVNDAPATTNVSTTTDYETATNITLSGTDIDGDTLTYSIVSDVSNGSTSLSGSTVSYTPNSTWSGTDTFTYKANDGTADSNTATVTITVNVDDAPVSSFTADETSGYAPQRVVFTNASTNSLSYAWDFGDGNTSTDQNPKHTYTSAGTFTVTLTATGSGGSDSKTATITVSAVPNSSLTIDPKYIINKSTSSIEIKVKQVTNLTSAQLVLNIPTGMTINSVASGAFLKGNTDPLMITTDNISSNGTYSISITSLSSDLQSASGDGTLATVTFTNSSTASSNVTFNTSNTKFLDNNGNTITVNQTIGVFLVTE